MTKKPKKILMKKLVERKAKEIAEKMGRNYITDAMREMAKDELKKVVNNKS